MDADGTDADDMDAAAGAVCSGQRRLYCSLRMLYF
jgi:hypothetical protein